MITKFKIFENELIKEANYYVGKFFIAPYYMKEYDWIKEDFYIILITDVDFNWKNKIWPHGDSFTVMKNGNIEKPAGWGYQYSDEEFNMIKFMTPQEFYNYDKELCEKLYLKVYNESKNRYSDWYVKMLKNYKNVLETIPELQYLIDSEKYNL